MIRRSVLSGTTSGGSSAVYPLSAYGFHSASDNPAVFTTTSTVGTFYARIYVPAGAAIAAVGTVVSVAGTAAAGGLNGFGIYSDTGTLLGSTTTDDTLWATAGWRVKSLASPIPAGAARFVIAGITVNGYSAAPSIPYCVFGPSSGAGMNGGNGVTNRRAFFGGGLSSWAASINPATEGTVSNFLPLVALG